MNRLIWAAVGLACAVTSSGCATIIGGASPQNVSIRTNPTDASIQIFDARTGATVHAGRSPVMIPLAKSNGYFDGARYRVAIQKPGFAAHEVIIDSHPGGWYLAGNLAFGGLIGWLLVDPATGAMWTLAPDDFSVDLVPEGGFDAPPAPPAAGEPAAAAAPVQVSSLEAFTAEHPELAGRLVPVLD